MKIKNRIKDNGNWSKLKTPLLIVLLAILTFLLTFQEEAYSKVITYVAALGTGIPVVIKLLSFFDKSKPAKEQ
jgi:fumarate reductase subunit D